MTDNVLHHMYLAPNQLYAWRSDPLGDIVDLENDYRIVEVRAVFDWPKEKPYAGPSEIAITREGNGVGWKPGANVRYAFKTQARNERLTVVRGATELFDIRIPIEDWDRIVFSEVARKHLGP